MAAAAASGFRFNRFGPIAEVLQLESFAPALTNPKAQVVIAPKFVPMHRTEAALVNGTAFSSGKKTSSENSNSFPRVAGYEGIAQVADAASNGKFNNGDWVYVCPPSSSGLWCNKNVVNADSLVAVPQSAVAGNPLAGCLSCFITAGALVDQAAAQQSAAGGKSQFVVQNAGSSLTSLAISALCKQKGLKIVTAASPGPRFAAAEKRHKAFGSDVVPYTAEGARAAAKVVSKEGGARVFFNGVGGRQFNDFLKLTSANSSTCITYGAQHSYGLMWAGSQLVYKDLTLAGFYLPRYLAQLDEKARQEKVTAALELAKALKDKYPVDAVKSLDAVPAAWDKMYVDGGSKPVIQL